ncbi:MAG TPA: glycosyltransferase family 39 protein [Ktedonobacteraceae bacterium]|nr:glycosyltransferase family 39 protein [Ktedonobacteraceae bacterium]
MLVAPALSGEKQPDQGASTLKGSWPPLWRRLALAALLLISVFMNFYQLGQNGYANAYYAAGIRSMLDSWHNFFFVSFDPGGFVTIDKPPLGFWLQEASAKILGFSPFSILLPQALAGVLAVLVLYLLIKRHFGVTAGLLAALALAISPISVVTNRNNTIDSTLVLVLLLGAWAVIRAAETGKLRWLLLCAVFVGLGFNIKMMEAYLVVPAFGLLYLLAAPERLLVRIGHLALALLLMLVISLSWAVAVDLTPASQRPYVGSTQDNSELSLAIGYNGVQRLLGAFGGPGGGNRNNGAGNNPGANGVQNGTRQGGANAGQPGQGFPGAGNGGPPQGLERGNGGFPGFGGGNGQGFPGGGNGGNGGGMFNTGNPGLLRLFNEPLGGQIVWLLPMALLSMLAVAWQWSPASSAEETQPMTPGRWLKRTWQRRPRLREDLRQQGLIVWGAWLLTVAIFFSVASFFHQYYLATLAPAICALFGIGVVVMWQDYRRPGWRGWLLPLALALTALEQIHIITSNPAWGTWLVPVIAITCVLAVVSLCVARLLPLLRNLRPLLLPASGLALAGLLITSAVWSAIPGLDNIAANLPTAGPTQSGMGGGGAIGSAPAGNGGVNVNSALVNYLEANRGGAKYLVAVGSSNEADSLILATNQPVMALGGFSGSDPILTTDELAALVKQGTVRFFLLGGMGGGNLQSNSATTPGTPSATSTPGASGMNGNAGTVGGGQGSLTSWVTQNCTAVSSSAWQSGSGGNGSGAGGFGGNAQLYDCKAAS